MTETLIDPRLQRNVDRILLLAVGLIMTISVLAIYFSKNSLALALRQGAYFVVGTGLMVFVASRDYARITRYALPLYLVNVALLTVVAFLMPEVKGAQRWIPIPIPGVDFKIQPSEFAKVITIITLAAYLVRLGQAITTFRGLIKSLLHVSVPVALIMKQPDLGTSLVLVTIWLGMVFLAGADWRHLAVLAVAGVALFGIAWQTNLLKQYQKERVLTLFDPMRDPKGDGYHILQSIIAIGGGQATGQGLGKGLQTNGRFIPENNTDFIFTVIGEEAGFVGACALIGVYGLFLWRAIATIADCEESLGQLIAGGVVTLFTFHLVVNIGMTCGVLPVVGVPLPLVSFGGSAAWANLMAIGLLISVRIRRHKIQF